MEKVIAQFLKHNQAWAGGEIKKNRGRSENPCMPSTRVSKVPLRFIS